MTSYSNSLYAIKMPFIEHDKHTYRVIRNHFMDAEKKFAPTWMIKNNQDILFFKTPEERQLAESYLTEKGMLVAKEDFPLGYTEILLRPFVNKPFIKTVTEKYPQKETALSKFAALFFNTKAAEKVDLESFYA